MIMKRRWYFGFRARVKVHGDGYFISSNDSSGVSRMVIYEHGDTARQRIHKFVCDFHNVHWTDIDPKYNEA